MCKTNLCTGTIEFISKQVKLQRTRKGKISVVWLNMKSVKSVKTRTVIDFR